MPVQGSNTPSRFGMLVEYSRLISASLEAEDVLTALADLAIKGIGTDGCLIVSVDSDGKVSVAESRQIRQEALHQLNLTAITADLATRLMAASDGCFRSSKIFPMMGHGNLYGALFLFFYEKPRSEEEMELAGALCDLTALALFSRSEYSKLRTAYAALRESHQALAHSEKLRLLGEMSASVSHDLKNVLQPIFMGSRFIQGHCDSTEEATKAAKLMEIAAKRGLDIVERLRGFSRRSESEAPSFRDPNELIEEAAALCRPRLQPSVSLTTETGNVAPILIKPSEFVSALVNLIVNANDAIAAAPGFIEVRSGSGSTGTWIEIQDNGPGIPKEIKDRLFQPFFTTKGEAGTGLGLVNVKRFVHDSNGTLEVDTAPGNGTIFRMTFPYAVSKAAQSSPTSRLHE